jgi:hypothetical protein
MNYRFQKALLASAIVCFVVPVAALAAQIEAPLRVGIMGGVQQALPPMPVPERFKNFVPEGAVLRAVLPARMSEEGETLLLYDNGEAIYPEICLTAIRSGEKRMLFRESVSAFAGLLLVNLPDRQQVLIFAYHIAGDQSDTHFVMFGAEGRRYRTLFEEQTFEGRLRILSFLPVQMEIWSANPALDQPPSCIWCPHRYDIETYVWRRNRFRRSATRRTPSPLLPGDIARDAIDTTLLLESEAVGVFQSPWIERRMFAFGRLARVSRKQREGTRATPTWRRA